MKKRIISVVLMASAIAMASCSKEESKSHVNPDGTTFVACIDGEFETRTLLTDERKVNWESGDKININGAVYTATPQSDATRATFTLESGETPSGIPRVLSYGNPNS